MQSKPIKTIDPDAMISLLALLAALESDLGRILKLAKQGCQG